MPSNQVLSLVSHIVFIGGSIIYILGILSGENKPAKVTWLSIAVINSIALLGLLASEKNINPVLIVEFACILIIAISSLTLRYETSKWTKLDYTCAVIFFLSFFVMRLFTSSVPAISISFVPYFVSFIPTIVTTWRNPDREDSLAWLILWLSSIIAILSYPAEILLIGSQPIAFAVSETIILYSLITRRYKFQVA